MKKVVLLILIAASAVSYGQDNPLPAPEANFAAIIVNNIDTSINWYSDHFGFEVLTKFESEERGFKQANLKSGTILLELIEFDTSVTAKDLLRDHPKKTRIDGFFKWGFLVSEFDHWIAKLRGAGIEFYGEVVTDPLSGKKMIIVKDPDGNRIQLFEK